MPILVTGATGLLGNNIVRQLLAQGRPVRVLVRPDADPRPLDGLDVEVVEGDVRDAESVRRACHLTEGVIHAAALVHIGHTRTALQREINVEGTRHVAEAAQLCQIRLVHVSTINALGVARGIQPFAEDTLRAPNVHCGYVSTKRASEEVVRELLPHGLDAVIVNPSLMFGPWDWKPSSGQMFLQVVQRQPLLAPPGGVSICSVEDVADAVIAALDLAPTGRQYILAGHNVTYLALWQQMAQLAGSRPPQGSFGPLVALAAGFLGDLLSHLGGSEGEVNSVAIRMSRLHHYCDSNRAITELRYRIRPLEETLERAYEWLAEHHQLRGRYCPQHH